MTSEARSNGHSTILYFAVVVIIVLVGVSITLWGSVVGRDSVDWSVVLVSCGTGVLATGLASLALGLIRWVDNKDAESVEAASTKIVEQLDVKTASVIEQIVGTPQLIKVLPLSFK